MKNVAYVEDCIEDYVLLKRILKNVNLIHYKTYSEYRSSKLRHDALIADINLPDMNLTEMFGCFNIESTPVYLYSGVKISQTSDENLAVLKKRGVTQIFLKGRDELQLKEILMA